MVMRSIGCALALATLLCTTAATQAQYFDDHAVPEQSIGTPERMTFELRIGPYQPYIGTRAFEVMFGDDPGLLLATEVDILIYRIPYVGPIGLGLGIGWAGYSGHAFAQGTQMPVSEETSLTLIPMAAMAVLRVDALAREAKIPLVFTGKLGLDAIFWSASTGDVDDASNVSIGLHWAIQVALELDAFDLGAARTLDEDWGINHTFLFVEVFGSTASSTLSLGPADGFAWTVGLGLVL